MITLKHDFDKHEIFFFFFAAMPDTLIFYQVFFYDSDKDQFLKLHNRTILQTKTYICY